MARLYVESYVRLHIAIHRIRLLISWRRWYIEDCMRIPACEILEVVGKRFADALVSCWIRSLFLLVFVRTGILFCLELKLPAVPYNINFAVYSQVAILA